MKTKLLIALACLGGFAAQAQQEALYTHYMYNTLAVNPGYAGSRDALTLTALGRFQWVGFTGAPMTQTFTAHTPVGNKKLGLGMSLLNDHIGPINNTALSVDVAYRMKVGQKANLCFGVKSGIENFNAGLNKLVIQNDADVSFQSGVRNRVMPNVGAGVYFHTERFYTGVSVPKIVENGLYATQYSSTVNIGQEKRHYYFIMGGIVPLTPQIKFKPTVLAKMTESAPAQADVTANFVINDIVTVGAMYRTGDAFGGLFGVNLTEQFALGYSFDWSMVNTTGRYNSGSHELMLRYDFIYEKERRIKSPRYF